MQNINTKISKDFLKQDVFFKLCRFIHWKSDSSLAVPVRK